MAYRLHKETPQLRIKIEEPYGQADISLEMSGETVLLSVLPHLATTPRCGLYGQHPHIPSGWTENH